MIPSPDFFLHLAEYVTWADEKQLAATKPLSDEAYFKDYGWSFGNMHKLMVHMLSAQSIWLDRVARDRTPTWLGDDPRMAERSAIEPAWRDIHERFAQFLGNQTPQSLAADVHYTNLRGRPFTVPLWNILMHALNHSMHHRGQLNSMIKLSGGEPAEVDYSVYNNSMRAKP